MRPFRPLVAALMAVAFAVSAAALPPRTIPFQGKLTDAAGNPVPDGPHTVAFRLYSNAGTTGTPIWTEPNATVTTTNGYFTTQLGSPTTFLSANLLFDEDYYLSVQVGSDPEMKPRVPLNAAAYATGLSLPIAAYVNLPNGSGYAGINITQAGNGAGIVVEQVNPTTNSAAIAAASSGAAPALSAGNTGTGSAAYFTSDEFGNTSPAVQVEANGAMQAVFAENVGTGRAGEFSIDNPDNDLAALYGLTNGSGKAVAGVNSGTGVAGYFNISNAANTSAAVYANSGAATTPALEVAGGVIKVDGAAQDSATTVFIHVASSGNISGARTLIDDSVINGDAQALLIVTMDASPGGTNHATSSHPYAVNYDGSKWGIINTDGANMPSGVAFNVLVLKR